MYKCMNVRNQKCSQLHLSRLYIRPSMNTIISQVNKLIEARCTAIVIYSQDPWSEGLLTKGSEGLDLTSIKQARRDD